MVAVIAIALSLALGLAVHFTRYTPKGVRRVRS